MWRKTPGLLNGPLNRSGVSGSTVQTFIWYGFSACLTGVTTSKTYYVGIGADNEYRLVLDGQEILNTYTPTTSASTNNFRYWNVYPVQMDAGNHTLEIYGMNDPGAGLNPHGYGMEVYDNTLSQLTAATSVSDLNIIWSTSGRTTAEIVQNNAGYYLSSGYTCSYPAVYSVCSGNCVTYEYCYAPGITPTPTRSATPTPTASVTPTNTSTQTQTPTQTPTQTQTQTPTQTPSGVASQFVIIQNSSLDVSITDVTINGVSVTYESGANFPVDSGENGNFVTTELGTYDITVYYGASIPGQNFTIYDSNLTSTCYNAYPPGFGTAYGAVINSSQQIDITVSDGTC